MIEWPPGSLVSFSKSKLLMQITTVKSDWDGSSPEVCSTESVKQGSFETASLIWFPNGGCRFMICMNSSLYDKYCTHHTAVKYILLYREYKDQFRLVIVLSSVYNTVLVTVNNNIFLFL